MKNSRFTNRPHNSGNQVNASAPVPSGTPTLGSVGALEMPSGVRVKIPGIKGMVEVPDPPAARRRLQAFCMER